MKVKQKYDFIYDWKGEKKSSVSLISFSLALGTSFYTNI